MKYQSINPYNQELLGEYPILKQGEIQDKLILAEAAFSNWKRSDIRSRSELSISLAGLLKGNVDHFARLISLEMGKPIAESRTEVLKCASGCQYYAENIESFLSPLNIRTVASKSYVRFDPVGVVLGIMPWNFPFWQVLRFAVPALLAGNAVLLKHAPNVPQCALEIEKLFLSAGFPEGLFQNLFIENESVEQVVASDIVASVSFTGSGRTGAVVGGMAGRYLKKSVLELGGSDPFLVLPGADMKKTVSVAVKSRMINAGQSCIAAKRFIIHSDVYNEFEGTFVQEMEKLKPGNPFDSETDFGPLARRDLLENLEGQVHSTVAMGARVLSGGNRLDSTGNFFEATVLADTSPQSPARKAELFGPVAPLIKANSMEEIINLANDTRYGLGSSIWTDDTDLAERIAGQIVAGSVFINALMKSDPSMPFGGVKESGYGRELSEFGFKEFTNIKSVWIA